MHRFSIKGMRKKNSKRFTYGVSEVIGIVLILAIVVAAMTAVYILVFNPLSSHGGRTPAVDIIGTVSSDGTQFILEHRGGVALSGDIKVIVTYNVEDFEYTISDFLGGGVNSFSIGNRIVINPEGGDNLIGLQVSVRLIDPQSNGVLFNSIIQEGATAFFPIAIPIDANPLTSTRVALEARYFRRAYDGDFFIEFQYRESFEFQGEDQDWIEGNDVLIDRLDDDLFECVGDSGEEEKPIEGLSESTDYEFRIYLRYYIDEDIQVDYFSEVFKFRTGDALGAHWRFNDEQTSTRLLDTTPYNNHGTIPNIDFNALKQQLGVSGADTSFWFDGIDDKIEVKDDALRIAMIEPEETALSMEAWIKVEEDDNMFYGVDKSVKDFSSFSIQNLPDLWDSQLIRVRDDVYAVIGREKIQSLPTDFFIGQVISFKINVDGSIDSDSCKTTQFTQPFQNDQRGRQVYSVPNIVRLPGNSDDYEYFAIVFSSGRDTYNSNNLNYERSGRIVTIKIHVANGEISKVDEKVFANDNNREGFVIDPDIIQIPETDKYIISYGQTSNQANQKTSILQIREISNVGDIENNPIATAGFEESGGTGRTGTKYNRLVHLHQNQNTHLFAIFFRSNTNLGYYAKFTINNENNIEFQHYEVSILPSFESQFASKIDKPIVLKQDETNALIAFTYSVTESGGNNRKIKTMTVMFDLNNYNNNEVLKELEIWASNEASQPLLGYYSTLSYLKEFDGYSYYSVTYEKFQSPSINNGVMGLITINHESGDIAKITNYDEIVLSLSNDVLRYPQMIILDTDDNDIYFAVSYSGKGQWGQGEIKTYLISYDTESQEFLDATIIDRIELGVFNWERPQIMHLTGDSYIIAYTDNDRRGALRTLTLNSDGTISDDLSQPFIFYDGEIRRGVNIEKITDTLFAVFYVSDQQGVVKTIEINGDGFTEQDNNQAFSHVSVEDGSIAVVRIKENTNDIIYSIIYRDSANDGKYCTIEINKNNGEIIKKTDDTLPNANNFANPAVTKVHDNGDSSIIAVLFQQDTQIRRCLNTYEIHYGTGEISAKKKRTWISQNNQLPGDIITASDGVVLLAYRHQLAATVGRIHTKTIDTNGNIQEGKAISHTHSASGQIYFSHPSLVHVTEDIYALSYRSLEYSNPGYFLVFRVGSNAAITDYSITRLDDFKDIRFPDSSIARIGVPHMIKMPNSDNHFAIVHAGRDYFDAYVTTLNITKRDFQKGSSHVTTYGPLIFSRDETSNKGYGLHLEGNKLYGRINNQWTTNPITLTVGEWNYIVFIYDRTDMYFILNGGEKTAITSYSTNIQYQTNTPFTIGRFKGYLSEMRVYNGYVLNQEEISNRYNSGNGNFNT